MKYLNTPLPQFHHELIWCHYYRGDEGEEAGQDENWGGVCCKDKGWIYGGEQKGGKKQDEEERDGGMCPGRGG